MLSVAEARGLGVCRVCGIAEGRPGPPFPFIYNFGAEYAHESCLIAAGLSTDPPTVADELWDDRPGLEPEPLFAGWADEDWGAE